MSDAVDIAKAMRRNAVEAMEATKPVNVYFGEVETVNPLTINVEQKMILGKAQLILTRNVTDFETMVTMNWESESSLKTHTHKVTGDDSGGDSIDLTSEKTNLAHTHMITGKKQITIHNGLDVGDAVVLIRQQGGQKFIVVDRIGVK